MRRRSRRVLAVATGLALLVVAFTTWAENAVDRERDLSIARGRALFHEGRDLVGFIGADRIPLEGELVACARCHGPRAQGGRGSEGAPAIHGRALRTAQPAIDADRPGRPPYNLRSLEQTLSEGHAPGGRALSWIMPRFELDRSQVADLLAYLEAIEDERVPGVTADEVVLGLPLPEGARWREAAEEMAAVLEAAFAEVNEGGGIYDRKLRLRLLEGEGLANAADEVLALVSGFQLGAGMPVIAPLGASGRPDPAAGRVFTLLPGPADQARWAVQHLPEDATLAVVSSDDPFGAAWAEGTEAELNRRGRPTPRTFTLGREQAEVSALVDAWEAIGVDVVLAALPPHLLSALVATAPERMRFVSPGALAVPDLPLSVEAASRLRFVYPAQLASAKAVPEPVAALLARHQISSRRIAFQVHAYAASQVVIEGLRRAGAQPTRESLVAALESLQKFDTGVMPPLTFGRGRNLGSQGARWVRLDPSTRQVLLDSDWLALSP